MAVLAVATQRLGLGPARRKDDLRTEDTPKKKTNAYPFLKTKGIKELVLLFVHGR